MSNTEALMSKMQIQAEPQQSLSKSRKSHTANPESFEAGTAANTHNQCNLCRRVVPDSWFINLRSPSTTAENCLACRAVDRFKHRQSFAREDIESFIGDWASSIKVPNGPHTVTYGATGLGFIKRQATLVWSDIDEVKIWLLGRLDKFMDNHEMKLARKARLSQIDKTSDPSTAIPTPEKLGKLERKRRSPNENDTTSAKRARIDDKRDHPDHEFKLDLAGSLAETSRPSKKRAAAADARRKISSQEDSKSADEVGGPSHATDAVSLLLEAASRDELLRPKDENLSSLSPPAGPIEQPRPSSSPIRRYGLDEPSHDSLYHPIANVHQAEVQAEPQPPNNAQELLEPSHDSLYHPIANVHQAEVQAESQTLDYVQELQSVAQIFKSLQDPYRTAPEEVRDGIFAQVVNKAKTIASVVGPLSRLSDADSAPPKPFQSTHPVAHFIHAVDVLEYLNEPETARLMYLCANLKDISAKARDTLVLAHLAVEAQAE